MRGSRRRDRGSGPPLKNHKNIGFFSVLFWIPWKITKLPSQHSILAIISMPAFCWQANGGLILVVFGCTHQLKKTQKKRQSWTLSEKTISAYFWNNISFMVSFLEKDLYRFKLLQIKKKTTYAIIFSFFLNTLKWLSMQFLSCRTRSTCAMVKPW